MQYVRCESCGAKAILAASRCPKCTHPLELRDHHGELVPLAQCRKCDTWYPRTRGGCKWCGTKPSADQTIPISIGVGVLLLVLAGAWWFSRMSGEPEPAPQVVEAPPVPSEPVVPLTEPATLPAADTTAAPIDSSLLPTNPATLTATPPLPAVAPTAPARQDTVTFRKFARARVVQFVNVRAAPDGKAPVLAVLSPGVRLDIGGRQSGWRLVRAEGVTGWADPKNFRVDSGPPR